MKQSLRLLAILSLVGTGCMESAEQRFGPEGSPPIEQDVNPVVAHGLRLSALPLRMVTEEEGPLPVEITIHNLADSVVRFRPILGFGRWLDAEITRSDGSRLPRTTSIDPPNVPAVTLYSGETLTDTVDLRCTLPPVPGDDTCMAPYELSEPGEYQIRMYFTLPCQFRDCGEPVTIEAVPFTINVEE